MKKNTIKRILSFGLALVLTISLSACKSEEYNTQAPTGDISGNYATNNNHTLTNLQLYDMLRPSGYSTLYAMVEEEILSNYVNENGDIINYLNVNFNDDYEAMQQLIIETVFGLEDFDDLIKMTNSSFDDNVEQIVDTLYLSNIIVTAEDFGRNNEKLIYPEVLFDYFKLNLAKENFGADRLTEIADKEEIEQMVKDEDGEISYETIDNNYYISEDDVETYYNNSYRQNRDYQAVIVGFNTLAEYNDAVNGLTITEANVVNSFISLYNSAYAYRTALTTSNIDTLSTINADKLSAFNTSLASFVTTLEAGQFTTSYKEFGGKYYMVYKISDTTTDKWEDLTTEQQEELYNEVYQELFDSKVTSSFISSQIYEILSNLFKTEDIVINDPVLGLLFGLNFSDYEYDLEELTDKTNVFTMKYGKTTYKISADALYERLAKQYGVATAINYFINYEVINSDLANNLDEDNEDNAQDAFDAEIEKFENNEYAAQGITSEFSEAQFLSMMFGYDNEAQVISNYYMAQEAIAYLSEDYSDLYFELLELTGVNNYNNHFNLKIEHVLLFVDYDLDGTLDDPQEFMRLLELEDNGANKVAAFEETIINIYSTIYEEANYLSGSISDNLTKIVRMFNNNDEIAYSQDGTTWDDIKTSGGYDFNIQVKVEDLGVVDNSSSASYVTEFSDHVEAMYRDLYDYVIENELTNTDEDSSTYVADLIKSLESYLDDEHFEEITTDTSFDELCMSQFGFHMLLSTDGSGPSNARFTYSQDGKVDTDDEKKQYEDMVITYNDEEFTLSGYSDTAWPSMDQIKVYVYEVNSDDGVENLKTSTETIINQFYSTFTSRYTDATFTNFLLYNMLDMQITFKHSTVVESSTDVISTWFTISQKQLDSYKDTSSTSTHAYAGWWEYVETYEFK